MVRFRSQPIVHIQMYIIQDCVIQHLTQHFTNNSDLMTLQLRDSSLSSSVPSSTCSYKYDVFLSFRGADTRDGFTGHLYRNLVRRGVKTFIDDKELPRGEQISQALFRVVEESKLFLVVFSENYASSKWCLDELAHILECRRSKNKMVHPIFYKVDPSDVRHQRGTYGKALAEHERRFQDYKDRVLRWRAALTEAANLSGSHYSSGYEAEFIERIVDVVIKKIRIVKEPTYLDMPEYKVLDSRVQDMLKLLDVGTRDVRMVGIWGIGGIGKTTIAKAVYNEIAHKFDGCCFLADVTKGSEQHEGLVKLQNKLLSSIVGLKELTACNDDEGVTILRKTLRHQRILLVVDDVDSPDQLEKLAGRTDWFGHGSRVIITTSDAHLLISHQVSQIYKAWELNHDDACEFFCAKAKVENANLDDNEKLIVTTVVKYAHGIPLALEVLGSFLCDTSIHEWPAMLDGFEKDPPKCIQDILTISYDGLQESVKNVFLDIACFFIGWKRNEVIQILKSYGRFNPVYSIKVLQQKSLVYVDWHGDICMHDLLEDMGKVEVLRESTEPGKRSRLWHYKDVQDVLTENRGTSKIEGIIVKMPTADAIQLHPKCFKKMENLKIFINVNGWFVGKVDCYPNQLQVLDWHECPLQYLPSNFDMKKMVPLNMCGSHISRFGRGFEVKCEYLTQIPDVSGIPNLEKLDIREVHPSVGSLKKPFRLNLSGCRNLVKLPGKVVRRFLKSLRMTQFPYVSGSPNLEELNLSNCTSSVDPWVRSLQELRLTFFPRLENFPPRFGQGFKSMQNLTSLTLEGCKSLTKIPDVSGIPSLRYLILRHCTSLVEIHPSVGSLEKLARLNLFKCSNLVKLPGKVNWRSLQELHLVMCSRLESFPEVVGEMKCMTVLSIWRTGIKGLPSSIRNLVNLEKLIIVNCGNLTDLPCSIYELHELREVHFSKCRNLVTFPNKKDSNDDGTAIIEDLRLGHEMECLKLLDLSGTAIKELPSAVSYLSSLQELVIKGCENLTKLPSNIYELQHLWRLDLQDCSKLDMFPEWSSPVPSQINSKTSHNLWYLNLCGCKRLKEIPELPPTVEWINVADCVQLESFAKLSNILEHKESDMIKCITMFNCQTLCDSLAHEMAKKRNVFLNEVTLCSVVLSCMQSEFDIVFPGSEVPEWFSRRKDLMELTGKFEFPFKIASNINSAYKGFAICAAAATVENFYPDKEEIMQQCSFTATIDFNGDRIVTRSFYFEAKYIELPHVWLCYIPFDRFMTRELPALKCGIILEHSSQGSLRIKSIGVHLVSAQDEDEDEDENEYEDEDEYLGGKN